MLPAKEGTILPNKIFSDIKVAIVKTDNLTAKNKISFFGNDPVEQQVMDYSIESIVNGLKSYGLASQNTFWYLQEGPFNGTVGPDTPYFQGFSTSISYDGNTIASGGSGYELPVGTTPFPTNITGGIGATWTFTRDSFNVWKQQQTVSYNGYNNPPIQGFSVSLSGDGNTLAIGAINDSDIPTSTGKVYVYVKSGNSWSFQEVLNPTGYRIEDEVDYIGYSLSLSHDGNVLISGGPGYYNPAITIGGAIWIFRRSGTTWAQDDGPIVPYNTVLYDTLYIGQFVDVSSDGNTFVTSGVFSEGNIPMIFVYVYTNGSWIKNTHIVVNETSNLYLPVSISGDGNTIIFGRSLDNSTEGTVDIFIKTDDVWIHQTTLLGTGTAVSQGITVSLSYSGDTAAFTGYTNEGSNLWIFNRTDGIWTRNGVAIPIEYTVSAKLSGDGKTLVTGSCNNQEIRIYKN